MMVLLAEPAFFSEDLLRYPDQLGTFSLLLSCYDWLEEDIELEEESEFEEFATILLVLAAEFG